MTLLDTMRYLVRGPGASSVRHSPNTRPIVVESLPSPRTSYIFDTHLQESGATGTAKTPQAVSLAWDERESKGIVDSTSSWLGMTARERKEILLSIYLANPWVSDCVDVIANRIASGGYVIEEVDKGEGSKANYQTLQDFILRINDEWDFNQFVRSSIQDILTFGESFSETTWRGGVPWQLFLVDSITMRTRHDRYGRVLAYEQQLDSTSVINPLDPKNIIRWWRPHLRAKVDPFSPIEKVQDAVLAEGKMVKWIQTFFQKGAKYPYYIQGGAGFDRTEAERYKVWYEQNYTGEKNAQVPPITYGDTKIVPLGKGSIDIDFAGGRDRNRTEIISAFHVPPAIVSIIESGNIGGGTGEDQDKSFQYNACDPVKQLFFEKFNDRITKRGFGITDWRISSHYADFRSDKDLAEVQDKRIRNGSVTINESREDMGKKPYVGSGDVAVIVTTKEVTPIGRLGDLESEARSTAQAAIQLAQANADKAQTEAKQAKEPPPEPPVTPPTNGTEPPKPPTPPGSGAAKAPAPPPEEKPAKSESALQADITPEELAHFFHNTYERLAPEYNYQTRKSSAVAWNDVPANNKKLMIAVAGEVLKKYAGNTEESYFSHQARLPALEDLMQDVRKLIEDTESRRNVTHETTEQTTHPQSETSHDEHAWTDTQESDRTLQQILRALTHTESGTDSTDGRTESQILTRDLANRDATLSRRETDRDHTSHSDLLAEDAHHTGMMLAFMLDSETAKQLALPDGEPADSLHITLAYLGSTDDEPDTMLRPDTSPDVIGRILQAITSTTAPLIGKVGGIGRFTTQADASTPTPIIATVDVPGLVELQTQLVDALKQANYFIGDDHGYTPHVSLAFIDKDAPMPVETVPPLPLTLDTVMLCIAGERFPFKLTGNPEIVEPQQESVVEDTQPQQEQSDSDTRKAELAAAILALFLAMQKRGASALTTLSAAIAVYAFSDEEKQSFIKALAEAYLWGQMWAYMRAMDTVGFIIPSGTVNALFTFSEATAWATEQVHGILDTFSEMFSSFVGTLPHDMPVSEATQQIDAWFDRYTGYKAPQVANYTVGTAVNIGTRTATTDMLDALTNVGIDTSMVPDGMDASNIRVRVVPPESSSDECSNWAGRDFPLEDAGDVPFFPMHSNCIHTLEVFVVGDESDV